MAVTSVREIWTGRDGEADDKARRYSRVFRVLTDSNYDEAAVVGSAIGIPAVGEVYPNDSTALCRRVRPRQESFSPRVWIVTALYSSEREFLSNPLADPALIRWDGEQFQRPATTDRNGDGIVNSAGDPFDPPPEIDDSRTFATVRKNVGIIPARVLNYKDALNSDAFLLDGVAIAAGLAKMQRISISEWQVRNGVAFRIIEFTIQLDANGWQLSILDAGFREKDMGFGHIKILNGDGTEVQAPALLDGAGAALANPSASNAVYLNFDVYAALPFGVLPLV